MAKSKTADEFEDLSNEDMAEFETTDAATDETDTEPSTGANVDPADAPSTEPKPPREVKIYNDVSTTEYNQMRKEINKTPRALFVEAVSAAMKKDLDAGTISEVTHPVIDDHVADALTESAAGKYGPTALRWWNAIGERAKTRVYNEIANTAVGK